MDTYMGIMCHYVDEEWLFRSIILETMQVNVSQMVKNILSSIEGGGI